VGHLCYMKGFCELLCWVSTRALGNMRYLTINTRSNRVVIISSVITRIFKSVQFWTVTFQPISIKTLVIIYVVHSAHVPVNHVVIIIVVQFILLLFHFIQFLCLMFIVQRKRFNSDHGLYSSYLDPIVREVPVHHHLCKSNKHHTSDWTVFVLV
jgi:hypothetical protein